MSFDVKPSLLLATLAFIVMVNGVGLSVQAQEAVETEDAQASVSNGGNEERSVRFAFRQTPWTEVLKWIADECDVSFNLDYTPRGTLNFVDESRSYTPSEALDEINGQLLARGYTLIRRYKTLYIVDLDAEIDQKFISDLLNETPLEDLDDRGRFELAKVRFPLTTINTEDAQKQIEQIIGPQGSIVTVPLARQLIVTETGENLRTIRDILSTVEARVTAEGLRSYRLKSAHGEDVLAVAKPLLGIAADANATEDGSIRISTDTKGKVVYATGEPEKLKLAQQIVEQVDADAAANAVTEQLQLVSHRVHREDPAIVLRILETLFAGDPRIRLQSRVDNILAYATAEQHRTIRATISEVEQEPTRIEVIPLRRNSPTIAVALIERMFGADDETENPNAPIIDATFEPNQIIVRGSAAQIDQIKDLLSGMGERFNASGVTQGPTSRIIPIDPENMQAAVERLRQILGDRVRVINQSQSPLIRVVPHAEQGSEGPQDDASPGAEAAPQRSLPPRERVRPPFDDDRTTDADRFKTLFVVQPQERANSDAADEEASPSDARTNPQRSQRAPDIILSPTPNGLLIISQDADTVDTLEEMLMGIGTANASRYHLFHLKHIQAEEAQLLIESLFTGGAGVAEDTGSTSDRSGVLGLMGGTSGSTLGVPKIIADKRLNRMFVQGTQSQIKDVGEYLRIIDVADGPVEVQTNPRPHFIPVRYTSAASIVDVLKEIYADRIFDPNARNRQQQSGGRGGFAGGFGGFGGFGGRGGGGGQQPTSSSTTGDTPKMTVAADVASNVVVVSATGALLREVEQTVYYLDNLAESAPAEDFSVGRLTSGANPEALRELLAGAYGDLILTEGSGLGSTSPSSGTTTGRGSTPTPGSPATSGRGAIFQRLFGGGGPGGGGPGAFGGRGFGGRIGFGGGGPEGGGPGGGDRGGRGGGPGGGRGGR